MAPEQLISKGFNDLKKDDGLFAARVCAIAVDEVHLVYPGASLCLISVLRTPVVEVKCQMTQPHFLCCRLADVCEQCALPGCVLRW